MDLYLDTETFGEEPIKGGAYRYAEKSEVMLVALAVVYAIGFAAGVLVAVAW